MYSITCPICDYKIQSIYESEILDISTCPECKFNFKSNICPNTNCRKQLHFTESYCSECDHYSSFYVASYDIDIQELDEN